MNSYDTVMRSFNRCLSDLRLNPETYDPVSPIWASDTFGLLCPESRILCAIIHQRTQKFISEELHSVGAAFGLCESPIEKMLLFAMQSYATLNGLGEVTILHSQDEKFYIRGEPQVVILPQAKFDRYRIDFRVTYSHWADNDKLTTTTVLVECDGHDYHERTKDQAKRDRSKDRKLQSAGYRIYRFTGAEIWADAMKCAAEIFSEAS